MQVELTDAEAKVVRSALARCMAEEVLRPTLGNRLLARFNAHHPDDLADAREALERIAELCEEMADAYPESIFPKPPKAEQAKDGIAADVLRDVACPQFADAAMIARAALTRTAPR